MVYRDRRLINRYETEGESSFLERSRRPHHCPHEPLGRGTPTSVHEYSPRPCPKKIEQPDDPIDYQVLKVFKNGSVRWRGYHWVSVARGLMDEYIGFEEVGNGIWKGWYQRVHLEWFDENEKTGKARNNIAN